MAEEKGSKLESKGGQPKDERQFNQEQYDRLIECSKKGPKGIKEWNEWRAKNPDEEIWLEGAELTRANLQGAKLRDADLQGAKLEEANLGGANLVGTNLQGADLRRAYLEGAKLLGAKLEGAKLSGAKLEGAILLGAKLEGADLGFAKLEGANLEDANLEGADLSFAKLEGANLEEAKLQGAKLGGAKLQEAFLIGAKLQGAKLGSANLQGAKLQGANLQGANVKNANLQGADLWGAKLQGAKFEGVIVNGATSFLYCQIDKNTDFRHTGLENARIESGSKYLLKYNVRRMNWEDWYGKHRFLQWPVRLFWWISDYGISTGRIVLTFFLLVLVFASIYYYCGAMDYYVLGEKDNPGVVSNLFVVDYEAVAWWLVPLRAVYFSIVTMTTLGFGDMFANAKSVCGHLLLMLQVLLGYVLLGALITRFAVLFTSDGPAGSYTAMGEETKALLGKLKKDKEKAG